MRQVSGYTLPLHPKQIGGQRSRCSRRFCRGQTWVISARELCSDLASSGYSHSVGQSGRDTDCQKDNHAVRKIEKILVDSRKRRAAFN